MALIVAFAARHCKGWAWRCGAGHVYGGSWVVRVVPMTWGWAADGRG